MACQSKLFGHVLRIQPEWFSNEPHTFSIVDDGGRFLPVEYNLTPLSGESGDLNPFFSSAKQVRLLLPGGSAGLHITKWEKAEFENQNFINLEQNTGTESDRCCCFWWNKVQTWANKKNKADIVLYLMTLWDKFMRFWSFWWNKVHIWVNKKNKAVTLFCTWWHFEITLWGFEALSECPSTAIAGTHLVSSIIDGIVPLTFHFTWALSMFRTQELGTFRRREFGKARRNVRINL